MNNDKMLDNVRVGDNARLRNSKVVRIAAFYGEAVDASDYCVRDRRGRAIGERSSLDIVEILGEK